ncbi:MAG: type II secretion system F family protein [Lachnospiraceae bacterium]|nr:type II secretion system F family protein [Lachnospiraceae bacterium]
MQNYSYIAVDNNGNEKKGSMEAENEDKVVLSLKLESLIPIEIKKQNALTKDINIEIGGKPKSRDFSVFCRQFVSMTQAGVTIIDALNMLHDQTDNKKLKFALKEVQTGVEKGETLGNSMREQKIFPSLLLSMIDAGEASGSLDVAMERMAVHFEKDSKTKALVKKAMIYPIMVCIVAIGVVMVMLTFVIPNFSTMFEDMDMELPMITQMVLKMSDFVIHKWFILVAIIALAVTGIKWFKGTSAGEIIFGKIGLKLPLFGQITIKSSAARFARTVSTLLAAGISLVDAVEITANTMDNILIKNALLDAREEIVQGVQLSQPLERCGLFPPMVHHMTKIGEEAGDIEGLLEKLADYYDEEVEIATESLMAAMEPMIIIVLAVIVGGLVGATMAPMLKMYQGMDNL